MCTNKRVCRTGGGEKEKEKVMQTQSFISVPLIEIYLLRIRDAIVPELRKHLDALL